METNNQLYSANELMPFEPVHPGEVLSDELKARGISQKDFAKQIGIQASHLSAIIHGRRSMTPAVAAKIESGLEGIPADLWVNLQTQYNKDIQRRRIRTSHLVQGYSPVEGSMSPMLAEPGKDEVSVTLSFLPQIKLSLKLSSIGWVGTLRVFDLVNTNQVSNSKSLILIIRKRLIC